MKPQTRKIINMIATAAPVALIALSAGMKFSGAEKIKQGFAYMGVGSYITVLGMMELTFAILFIFPKTMRLGFILLSCYFAGALATEISHGIMGGNALLPLVLVWVSAFIRDRSIFMHAVIKKSSALR